MAFPISAHRTVDVPQITEPPTPSHDATRPAALQPVQALLACEPFAHQVRHISIDQSRFFQLKLEYDPKTHSICGELLYNFPMTQDLSRLRETMTQGLKATINGKAVPGSVSLKGSSVSIEIFLFDHLLHKVEIDLQTSKQYVTTSNPLYSYDLRRINQVGKSYLDELGKRKKLSEEKLLTADLHTHFGGAISPESIKNVIKKAPCSVPYPVSLLKEMKIVYNGKVDERGNIDLADPKIVFDWTKFLRFMSMHPLKVSTFSEMEAVYKYRGPILKNLKLFPAFLEELARDYREMGVRYAELSLSDIIKPEWMSEAIRSLPDLEAHYGVQMRFLVAFWRHSPQDFNEDLLDAVMAYEHNPYIVGIDIMGHETNSTRDFESILQRASKFRKEKRPDLVTRVHSGESICHPDNIELAVKNGATRIGHGIHGLSDELMKRMKDNDVIVECNLSSNNALYSVEDPTSMIPILTLMNHGVRVTIGTDGHGCYNTTALIEAKLATQCGIDEQHLLQIAASNESYIQFMNGHSARRLKDQKMAFTIPQIPDPKFPKDGWAKIEEERKEKRRVLESTLDTQFHLQVVAPSDLSKAFPDRVPILFAGATSISWVPVCQEDRQIVREKIYEFFNNLDPNKVVIVTGGTDFGLEKIVHEAVLDCRKKNIHFQLLGTLATQLQAELSDISQALTHATVIDNSWYDLAPNIIKWISSRKGVAYFIGGGEVVKNMIHIAKTVGNIDCFLMSDIMGSSKKAAELYPERAFSKHEGLGSLLLKSSFAHVLKSASLDPQKAKEFLRSIKKEIVMFLGYSSAYKNPAELEETINQALDSYDPQETIIAAGATTIGIGAVYAIAKKRGFQTLGVVSTLARKENAPAISPDADFVVFIEDKQWGGNLPDGQMLSPVSDVIVHGCHGAVVCGGGKIAACEAAAIQKLNKSVIVYPFERG